MQQPDLESTAPDDLHGGPPGVPSLPLWFPAPPWKSSPCHPVPGPTCPMEFLCISPPL